MESIIAKTEKQLNDAFFVRKEVFVKEQHVPEEEEIDQFEDTSEHIVIYDGGQPVGAGRWRIKDGHGKLERICVMKSHRSLGVGAVIMQALEKRRQPRAPTAFSYMRRRRRFRFTKNKDTALHPAKNFQMRASPIWKW